jgi:ATP-dependent RNA helicase DeaD
LIVPFNRRRKADALLAGAKLKVTWGPAPTAEEIRARDQERFLASSIFTDPATEEDMKLAESLQANRTAEEIARALVRIHRAQLPAPEDLLKDAGPPPRRDDRARAPRERVEHRQVRSHATHDRDERASTRPRDSRSTRPVRDQGREMVWFRVDIGRERKADPRWLLPLLCRAGSVTKAEIGSIKIFDRDTRFEIAAEFADKFEDAASSMKPNEGRISRVGASMGGDAGVRDNPAHTARKWKDDEAKAATSSDLQKVGRAKTPWRNKNKDKSGGPHHKGDTPKAHPNGPSPHAGSAKSNGAHKPVSKYAHKKKRRANQHT